MNKAEAIEVIRKNYPHVGSSGSEFETALRELIPELCESESEDERIRQMIENTLRDAVLSERISDTSYREMSAYLEKQKELFESGRGLYYYDCEKTTYCGYPATEENPYDFAMSQQEKQKEQKPISSCDIVPYIDDKIAALQDMWREEKVAFDWDDMHEMIEDVARHFYQKEQKPTEKQDYSDFNDTERAILRVFLAAGVENVPVTIIKETAQECLAQMKPAEWNDTDMKEARDNLISVCRDWERGKQTTLLPIAAVRARYFLEHLAEPMPAEWSEEDKKMLDLVISNYKYMTRKLRKGDGSDDVAGDIEVFSWLEFLPERFNLQPKQEWSEEDEKRIQRICDFLWKNRKGDTDTIYQIEKDADWLKSLRPSWKPSEEQMAALYTAARESPIIKENGNYLYDLYNDLKKLWV